jgi:hypothetical protein
MQFHYPTYLPFPNTAQTGAADNDGHFDHKTCFIDNNVVWTSTSPFFRYQIQDFSEVTPEIRRDRWALVFH